MPMGPMGVAVPGDNIQAKKTLLENMLELAESGLGKADTEWFMRTLKEDLTWFRDWASPLFASALG